MLYIKSFNQFIKKVINLNLHVKIKICTLDGLLNWTRLCFKFLSGPSTRHPDSLKWTSNLFHKGSLDRTFGLPNNTIPYFALVIATFNLLASLKNPIPYYNFLFFKKKKLSLIIIIR